MEWLDPLWLDVLGLFLLMAGFSIGLGAVSVIDVHSMLARHSSYWTEATTRTHKVTKPLIWLGVLLAVPGALIFFRNEPLSNFMLLQITIALVLILNGIYLTLYASPYLLERERQGKQKELLPESWQRRIMVSFTVSFIGWWSEMFLVVWYLLVLRG